MTVTYRCQRCGGWVAEPSPRPQVRCRFGRLHVRPGPARRPNCDLSEIARGSNYGKKLHYGVRRPDGTCSNCGQGWREGDFVGGHAEPSLRGFFASPFVLPAVLGLIGLVGGLVVCAIILSVYGRGIW
jgi:hypothetical protein